MQTQTEAKISGAVAAALALLLLFLLLWFVYIDMPISPEEEGIEVAFGDSQSGGGNSEQMPAPAVEEQVAPPPTPAAPSQNDLLTQEDEEALALARQRKEEEQRRKAEEAERLRKQKEEQERLEAERIAREKALAEKKAREQQARDNANNLMSIFSNQTDNSAGSGVTSGSGTQGNPAGVVGGNPAGGGSSGGNRWSLKGRKLKNTLTKPKYDSNQEGIIVVNIRVNAAGKVISTTKGQGTTISDPKMIQDAFAEARKAQFSAGEGDAVGTITYEYKNK